MTLYTKLLVIKQLQETQAEVRVTQERDAFLAARDACRQAEALLAELQKKEKETEKRLYGDLCDRVVHLRDIDEVKLEVSALRDRVALQQEAVKDAQSAQRKAESRLARARAAYMHAQRKTLKFVDLSRHFDLETQREADQREELEMEDAAMALRQRRESGGADSANFADTVNRPNTEEWAS